MDYRVLITDAAVADLKKIVEFVAADDPAAAKRLGLKLIAAALSLRRMPERFPLHDRKRAIHKMSVPPYSVFYERVDDAGIIYILHLWHGARRLPDFPS